MEKTVVSAASGRAPPTEDTEGEDYISLIRRAMDIRAVSLRTLAGRTGITKTRLGLLLHGDPGRRAGKRRPRIRFTEIRTILAALEIDLLQAVISVETIGDPELFCSDRYARLVSMLCAMFRDLPLRVITELELVEGIDGSEVRPGWADVIGRAVMRRVVEEISATASRRASLSEFTL